MTHLHTTLTLLPEGKENTATTSIDVLIAPLDVMTPDLTLHLPSEKQREVDIYVEECHSAIGRSVVLADLEDNRLSERSPDTP